MTADTAGTPERSRIARRREAALDEGGAAYLERRTEIIAAAARVFAEHGYRGTPLSLLAEELGLDRASLYYYIGSKEELFREIVGGAVEANCLEAESVVAGPGTAPEKLRSLIVALMESYAKTYPFLYFYIQDDLGHPVKNRSPWSLEMGRFNKRYENAITAIVAAGMEEGTLATTAEPWLICYGILGMLAWSNRWFKPVESPVSAAEIGRAYADTILRGLEVSPRRKGRPRST